MTCNRFGNSGRLGAKSHQLIICPQKPQLCSSVKALLQVSSTEEASLLLPPDVADVAKSSLKKKGSEE